MNDTRTPKQRYRAWVDAVCKCEARGWRCVRDWRFRSPGGSVHDLSAANLDMLDHIESTGVFLVKESDHAE